MFKVYGTDSNQFWCLNPINADLENEMERKREREWEIVKYLLTKNDKSWRNLTNQKKA